LIGSGHFSEGDRQLFHPLLDNCAITILSR
jgi:hypothetical protein